MWSRAERHEEARSAFEEALALARQLPYPYAEARLLTALSSVEDKEEDAAGARKHQEEALAIFRRLGAKKGVEHAEMLLAKL